MSSVFSPSPSDGVRVGMRVDEERIGATHTVDGGQAPAGSSSTEPLGA